MVPWIVTHFLPYGARVRQHGRNGALGAAAFVLAACGSLSPPETARKMFLKGDPRGGPPCPTEGVSVVETGKDQYDGTFYRVAGCERDVIFRCSNTTSPTTDAKGRMVEVTGVSCDPSVDCKTQKCNPAASSTLPAIPTPSPSATPPSPAARP
jgi:hypothetical protein